MEPENTIPAPNKKKFLLLSSIAIVGILVLIGYLFLQKNILVPQEETAILQTKTSEQIDKEKLITQIVQTIPENTLTPEETTQISKIIPKQKTLTDAELAKIVQSIPSSTTQ